jgi:colanic acid biosynthesis glycosyl transferase WcaI
VKKPELASTGPERLRVLFVNRYYAPDVSATSQMLTGLAEGLVRCGIDVSVVCSRQLYEDSRAKLSRHEVLCGVSVWRVASARFGRNRLGGRALDYLTFYLMATAALLRLAGQGDVIVLKTDPPLLSLIAWLVTRKRRVACVNWLQDLFPEVATRLKLSPLPRPLAAALQTLRDRSLAAADANVVLGTRMRDYLIARGIPPRRISVGENWADEDTVTPLPAAHSSLRRRLLIADRFVVAYSGNLGRAHDADTLLAAAQALRADAGTVFLLTGGGVKMRWLEGQARDQGLTQLRFLPYQHRAELADTLAAGDVHLVMLLPQLEGLIVPSKFYGILAAGRPLVFVGDPDGELARLVIAHRIGLSVACGDGAGLIRALCTLRDAPAERDRMGARARELFEQRYTLRASVNRWHTLLRQVAHGA